MLQATCQIIMASSKLERGRLAETAVAGWLEARGYNLLARNYAVPRLGELDLVMRRDPVSGPDSFSAIPDRRFYRDPYPCLAVVEVKARFDAERFGGPAAALTPAKLRRIRLTALHFQQTHHFMNNQIELLAALVQLSKEGSVQNIEIIPIEWQ